MRWTQPFVLAAAVLFLCAVLPAHAQMVPSFEPHVAQSSERLAESWRRMAADRRQKIQEYLLRELGLSSTGVIQLVGVYRQEASGELLHFQQVDLFGQRLCWSVLVHPADMTARVLYHSRNERISTEFVQISTPPDARRR